MTEIEKTIEKALLVLQETWKQSTFDAKKRYLTGILQIAERNHIDKPCQKLYDLCWTPDASHAYRLERHFYIRLIDRIAGTNALDENGFFLNEMPFPGEEEAMADVRSYISHDSRSLTISSLVVAVYVSLKETGLSKSTIGQAMHAMRYIRSTLYAKGITEYDSKSLQTFIDGIDTDFNDGRIYLWRRKIYRRTVKIMEEITQTGTFVWKRYTKHLPELSPEIEPIRQMYGESLRVRNLGKSIIGLHDFVFRKAVEFGKIETTVDLNNIDIGGIQAICSSFSSCYSKRSICVMFPILRLILDYLHEQGIMSKSLSPAIMSPNVQRGSVASFFPKAQEPRLLDYLEHCSRRDKAIVLLALRTGMREVDICNLKMENINWHEDRIEIVQRKTGAPLILPLLQDVGNAIMDYMITERPKRTGLPYVFLARCRPIRKVDSLYEVFRKACNGAHIQPVNGNAKGPYLFRYTIVNRLLEAMTPHQVITDTLGHKSKESNKPYISMEENMLRQCALDLDLVGIKTW